jgi:protein-L-isoaspartate(D-aspartate) O-methyltransferase
MISDRRVLDAFRRVKRELFVLPGFKKDAYLDEPLPILAGQTISQPTTVVLMLDAFEVKQGQKVLEIGAGSGYNAALLSVLVGRKGKVVTTEIVPELAEFAKNNLKKAKITNVRVIKSDGSIGYAGEAPYDRIICTAAAQKIPDALVSQLKEGGILLIPVGPMYAQRMIKAGKTRGKLETENLGEYVFVPLTGRFGIKE